MVIFYVIISPKEEAVNLFSWVNFLSYAVVTAITPGPNNILSMTHASRVGFRRSFPFHLGVWAGFSLVMLLCTVFCQFLAELIPVIKTPMLIAGALYLLWLAWKTFRSPPLEGSTSDGGGFLSGFILQFINPKIYIYCLVSMEAYILPAYQGQWGALMFFALLLAFIGFLFTLCWALFGSLFQLLFSKYARITNTLGPSSPSSVRPHQRAGSPPLPRDPKASSYPGRRYPSKKAPPPAQMQAGGGGEGPVTGRR